MKNNPVEFPSILQNFFSQHLIQQRNASVQTVASYRDSFRLLLQFAHHHLKKNPSDLIFEDLDAPMVLRFLDHLEKHRKVTVRTRNTRLAAIRSFIRYATLQCPAALPSSQRVLAIPMKRFDHPMIEFLSREEVEAILNVPSSSTWSGQRDRVLFSMLYNTGARVSEVIRLQRIHLNLGPNPSVQLTGKGRKQRAMPLWKNTVKLLEKWLGFNRAGSDTPLFPNRSGGFMSRSGVENRLHTAVRQASAHCSSLQNRSISPHTFRHTTAMHLLQAGLDITVIALWLGHESPSTTHLYMQADLRMKEKALEQIQSPNTKCSHYKPSDHLLDFLEKL